MSSKRSARLDREINEALRKPRRTSRSNVHALDVELASTNEHGVHFETGVPVTFPFLRNTEKSPHVGSTYGQDIEPHGRYLLHNVEPERAPPSRWVSGTVTFKSPLVIPLSGDRDALYGPNGWKARLRDATGKTGAALSRFLAQRFDGIVTIDSYGTSEIVDLSRLKP